MSPERRQVWGLRVLALGIAVALWFVLSYEQREVRSEKQVDASVSYVRPENVVILDQVQQAEVLLSGPQDEVGRVSASDVSVQVDLRGSQIGRATVNLGPENVRLPPGLRVERVRPSTLQLTLDRQITIRLPVEPEIVGEPAAGATVGEPTVSPPEVSVTGPESQLAALEAVQTAPVSLDGHAISFEETVPIVLSDILAVRDIEPPRVTVTVPLQVANPTDGEGDREP